MVKLMDFGGFYRRSFHRFGDFPRLTGTSLSVPGVPSQSLAIHSTSHLGSLDAELELGAIW